MGDRDSVFMMGTVVGCLSMSQRKATHPSICGQLQPYLMCFKKKVCTEIMSERMRLDLRGDGEIVCVCLCVCVYGCVCGGFSTLYCYHLYHKKSSTHIKKQKKNMKISNTDKKHIKINIIQYFIYYYI